MVKKTAKTGETQPSVVEAELAELTGVKPKPKEGHQTYLKRLLEKTNAIIDKDQVEWENLSEDPTQNWINAANEAKDNGVDIPDFNEPLPDDEIVIIEETGDEEETAGEADPESNPTEENEDTVTTKKTAKGGKKAAVKTKAPAKAKAKAATSTKPDKSKSTTNGNPSMLERWAGKKPGASPEWRKVLTAIGKKGPDGASREQIAKFCEQFGTSKEYARFIWCGYLKKVGRGQYALAAAGEKFLSSKA